jgi:hypothetical protein
MENQLKDQPIDFRFYNQQQQQFQQNQRTNQYQQQQQQQQQQMHTQQINDNIDSNGPYYSNQPICNQYAENPNTNIPHGHVRTPSWNSSTPTNSNNYNHLLYRKLQETLDQQQQLNMLLQPPFAHDSTQLSSSTQLYQQSPSTYPLRNEFENPLKRTREQYQEYPIKQSSSQSQFIGSTESIVIPKSETHFEHDINIQRQESRNSIRNSVSNTGTGSNCTSSPNSSVQP